MTEVQPEDRLVGRAEARRILGGVSALTLKRRMQAGVLPPEIVLSRYHRGWMLSDLKKVLAQAELVVPQLGQGARS